MTMPKKITLREHRIKAAELSQDKNWTDSVTYIRADIVQELALALDMAIENAMEDSAYVWGEVFRIRDAYRAITC